MPERVVIYWTDGLNTPRWLDITDLPGVLVPAVEAPENLFAYTPSLEEFEFEEGSEPTTAVAFGWQEVFRAEGYNLYIDGVQVNEDLISDPFYVALGLDFGIYEAYVVASTGAIEGDPSNVVEFELGPFPPIDLQVNLTLGNIGVFTWQAGLLAEGYDLYRVVDGDDDIKLNDTLITDLEAAIELPPGEYDVYAVGVAQGFNSPPSNTVTLDVPMVGAFDQQGLVEVSAFVHPAFTEEGALHNEGGTDSSGSVHPSFTEEGSIHNEGGTKIVVQAPENFTADSDGTNVLFEWDIAVGESYRVYINNGSGFEFYEETTQLQLTAEGLSDGIYAAHVTVVSAGEESEPSNSDSFLIGAVPVPANYEITLEDV